MCGIAGIYNYKTNNSVCPEYITKMTELMSHRGPDDEGQYIEGSLGFGFKRLSVIDLEGGHQPMSNNRGDIWLVFNGEIYNYKSLRSELVKCGHKFKTSSDTEVIIHAYEEFGTNCISKFRGMFAFAIWDSQKEKLFLVRDRLGIKPIYFYDDGTRFIFASEMKAVKIGTGRSLSLDYSSLEQYLTFRYVPGPTTILNGIRKIQPGEYLIRTKNSLEMKTYWQPIFQKNLNLSNEEYFVKTKELLMDSVKLQMNADVPLGVLLSGGLDSTSILALAMQHGAPVKAAFSIGYKDAKEFDETQYAKEAADYFGVRHEVLLIGSKDFATNMENFIWYQDEPLADASGIPLYLLCKEAKKTVTVLLSGEGADEIFAGYDRYKMAQILKLTNLSIFAPIRKLAATAGKLIHSNSPYHRVISAIAEKEIHQKIKSVLSITSERIRRSMLSTDIWVKLKESSIEDPFLSLKEYFEGLNPLDQMLLADLRIWLPENMLTKKDRMTMAASIEARVPFIDHELVEFGLKIPCSLKRKKFVGKYILRKSLKDIVPAENLNRSKMGWPLPLNKWLRHDMKTIAGDILLGRRCQQRGLFNSNKINKILHKHWKEKGDYGKLIFLLLCLEMWLQANDF